MKKIITTMFALAFAVLGTVSVASAQSVFNSPGAMPTLTITNATTNPCSMGPIDGCWQRSTTARPGEAISVHVYYKNTSNTPSQGTTLSIQPGGTTSAYSEIEFDGGVASLSGPRSMGTATVSFTSPSKLEYISGTAKWYPTSSSNGQSVNTSGLFGSSGFNIGTVNPGVQGVLVASFRVVGNGNDNEPEDDNCRIDRFTADDYSIDEGDSVELEWATTDCTDVEIYPTLGDVNLDGSRNVEPHSTTTYKLTAYDSNGTTRTKSLTITVDRDNDDDDDEDECRINSFTADDTSIEQGDSVRLRWETTGARSVDIEPVTDDEDADGDLIVRPNSTTTYTLRADCKTGSDKTKSLTVRVDRDTVVQNNTRPQAITTTATVLGSNAARLNGIAVPNSSYTTTAWFEWGPSTNLGYRTGNQVVQSNGTNYYSDAVSGLVGGNAYYYRAVVQNQNGVAYGDIVRFQTPAQTVVVQQPPKVIVQPPRVITNTVTAESAPSLLELRVESVYDRMCVNGQMDYTVSYRNISGQTLQNAVLRFTHPKEITYISSSRGDYEVVDRTITISLGNLSAGEQGTFVVHTRVNESAITGNLTVTTATVVYTNSITRAQEDAIAYSLITVSEDCPNLLAATAFGFGFLPNTLIEWLLLILIILALIVLGRQLSKKKESVG